jgi:hypothetical protein
VGNWFRGISQVSAKGLKPLFCNSPKHGKIQKTYMGEGLLRV